MVNENQPQLLEERQQLCAAPALGAETGTAARSCSIGPGRLEVRRLWSSPALGGYRDGPGLAQVLGQERAVTRLNTGAMHYERGYAVTRLPPEQADAGALLALWRGHGGIEHRRHRGRAVGVAEDRSAARAGGVPHGLAVLRNTVMGVLRAHDHATIAATRRALAPQTDTAVTLLGL